MTRARTDLDAASPGPGGGGVNTNGIELHLGDCLDVMRGLPRESVDSVVTDPPAGIGFMGKEWDRFGGCGNASAEQDRAESNRGPGAGLGNQPFGYSGSSLPRKGEREAFIRFLADRLAEALRIAKPGAVMLCWAIPRTSHWTAMAIEDAGWQIEDRVSHLFGTGFPKHKSKLKPACEDWWLARKPGGAKWLGVDACRIGVDDPDYARNCSGDRGHAENRSRSMGFKMGCGSANPSGRWPANVVLDEEAARLLDDQSGVLASNSGQPFNRNTDKTRHSYGRFDGRRDEAGYYGDSVGASRFYYVAKASPSDRDDGNTHPTVKSTELMRWLCRLATPPGGTILDPFLGSGSTAKAALVEGFRLIGVEENAEYLAIARNRLAAIYAQTPLFAESQP